MTNSPVEIDVKSINSDLMLLRLPGIRHHWQDLAERSDREGWPAAIFTSHLIDIEKSTRDQNRKARHLKESRLIPGKTLARFDFSVVPMIKKTALYRLSWRWRLDHQWHQYYFIRSPRCWQDAFSLWHWSWVD